MAWAGNAGLCFERSPRRSSATAPTHCPATTRQTAESAWKALKPRMAVMDLQPRASRMSIGLALASVPIGMPTTALSTKFSYVIDADEPLEMGVLGPQNGPESLGGMKNEK